MGGAGWGAPQAYGHAAWLMPQLSCVWHTNGQPVQMYTNPGTQPPPSSKQQQQQHGGPRLMTGMHPGEPAGGAAVGVAPGLYMTNALTMSPPKPKSHAIAIVDPNSGEAINGEPIKLAAAPSAEPAAPAPSAAATLSPASVPPPSGMPLPPPPTAPPPAATPAEDGASSSPAAAESSLQM